jgi:uncharacterized protein YbjT (DUF2867 family)
MRVAVIGGSGVLGRATAAALREGGHEVRAPSRRDPDHPIDLATGAGLDAALAGCDAVVDASNASARKQMRPVLVEGSARLLAAEARAGVGHHVCASIVGIDRVPFSYYRVKLEQEATVEAGAVPWTIVRATQFHSLLAWIFASTARARVLPAAKARLQPIDPREVAALVATVATAEPRRGRVTIAGPEVRSMRELASAWRERSGRRALLAPAPIPGALGRALRSGGLCDPDPDHRGTTSFERWLEAGGST